MITIYQRYESNIWTLLDDNDVQHRFYLLAEIDYNKKTYGVLEPAESVDGVGEGEAIVLLVAKDPNNPKSKVFAPVNDGAIEEEIFNIYTDKKNNPF